MKKVIYIIKGYAKTIDESNAMDFYLNEFYKYFISKAGGGWDKSELINLDNPLSSELTSLINKNNIDYSISIFIGHGATQDSNQLFQINKDEIIKAGQFVSSSPRQLLIFESCRSDIKNIPITDLSDKIPKFQHGGVVRAPITIKKTREILEVDILKSKKEVVACFACSIGETATNFYFSYLLLSTAMNWHLDPGSHLDSLKITALMDYIIKVGPKMIKDKIGILQTPQIMGNSEIPFTISKF